MCQWQFLVLMYSAKMSASRMFSAPEMSRVASAPSFVGVASADAWRDLRSTWFMGFSCAWIVRARRVRWPAAVSRDRRAQRDARRPLGMESPDREGRSDDEDRQDDQ